MLVLSQIVCILTRSIEDYTTVTSTRTWSATANRSRVSIPVKNFGRAEGVVATVKFSSHLL